MSMRAPTPAGPAAPPVVSGDEPVQILLVDDQPSNLDALEATLESTGCKFVLARSADEAVVALLDQDFAAIVLDVMMPGMNGFELATMIKRRQRTQQVPILFLTARMLTRKMSCAAIPRAPSITSPNRSTPKSCGRKSPSSS